MATSNQIVPNGFVLDQPSLPRGFVLDKSKGTSLPDGFILDEQPRQPGMRITKYQLGPVMDYSTPLEARPEYQQFKKDYMEQKELETKRPWEHPVKEGLKGVGKEALKSFTPENIGKNILAAGEAAGALTTGMAGFVAGVPPLVFGGPKYGQKAAEKVGEAVTYQPKTEQGRQLTGIVSKPFELLTMGEDKFAEFAMSQYKTLEETEKEIGDKELAQILHNADLSPKTREWMARSIFRVGLLGLPLLKKVFGKPTTPVEAVKETIKNPEIAKELKIETPPIEITKPTEPIKTVEEVKLAETPRQPWEMTKEEFAKSATIEGDIVSWKGKGSMGQTPWNVGTLDSVHNYQVRQAIKEGKIVPKNVLKDYPELGEQAKLLFWGSEKGMVDFGPMAKLISSKTSEMIESVKTPPEITRGVKAAKESMIEHDRNIRRAESTSKLFEKTVQDTIKDPQRQMIMVHAYEHKMKGKYWNQLTESEKGVVRWAGQEKAKLNKYIKDNDILETMSESEGINHIFHHWINPETQQPYAGYYGRFSKGLPQAKQRTIPTYEKGIASGMTPATTNIGKLIGLEWESATRANSARQLVKNLHGIKGSSDIKIALRKGAKPQPIRMVERWNLLEKQGLSEDYVRYQSPFLDKAISFVDSEGKRTIIKGSVGVQKELYPFVRAYIENPTYGKLSQLNFASKSLKLGVSMFHVVSLGMQELANLRMPFVHIPKGIRLTKELGPSVRLLHQEGLELFKGYEDLGYRNKFFDGGSKLGRTGNVLTWPITKIRDFIFNYVQPGMKTSFADMQLNKLLPRYLKDTGWTAEEALGAWERGKSMPKEVKAKLQQCAREVVQKADGHFSGEHYKRSLLETNRMMVKLYFTPEARKCWQAALLSPTWQREHLLVAKNVAKSFMPDSMIKKLGMTEMGPIKSQYQRYALGGIMIVGAVDAWNYMSTQEMDGEGKHIWENPPGKGFAVRGWWDEPDYITTDKNGVDRYIKGGPAYIRPLKSLFELAETLHDPFIKVGWKFSPIVTAIGKQFFDPYRKYEGIPDIPKRALNFITDSTTPIFVDQAMLYAQGKRSPQGVVFPFFGMPVSKAKEPKGERQ